MVNFRVGVEKNKYKITRYFFFRKFKCVLLCKECNEYLFLLFLLLAKVTKLHDDDNPKIKKKIYGTIQRRLACPLEEEKNEPIKQVYKKCRNSHK